MDRKAGQMRLFTVLGLALVVILLISQAAGAEHRINVFVSVLPQAYFVERIAGDNAEVTVMVGPGQSPATYEPTPRKMAKLSEADVYFRIGAPFENAWMDKIMSINPEMKVVDLRQGILLREMEHEHEHEGHSKHEEEASMRGKDPHVWLSPSRVAVMSLTICEEMIALREDRADLYRKNTLNFLSDLYRIDYEIRKKLKPYEGQKFMVFHPAWGYFAEEYGLQQMAIEVEGKSPSAKVLADIIDKAKKANIQVVFVQEQFSQEAAETLAAEVGARVVTLDPLARDYLVNLRRIANAIEQGLK